MKLAQQSVNDSSLFFSTSEHIQDTFSLVFIVSFNILHFSEVALLVRGFKCFFLGVTYLAQQRLPESAALFNNIATVLEQAAEFAGRRSPSVHSTYHVFM